MIGAAWGACVRLVQLTTNRLAQNEIIRNLSRHVVVLVVLNHIQTSTACLRTLGQITELSPPDVHQMQQSGEEALQNAGCTGGPSCRSMEKVVHQSASRYHSSDLAKHSRLLFETKHVHKKGLVFMS